MRATVEGWLTQEHFLIGASLARVLLGAWAVYYYALFWRDRHFLWGPDAIIPFARFTETGPFLNVLALNPSPLYFDVVYAAAVVIAILMTIGLWSRLVVPLHWVLMW